jgi:hypothetical protein
MSQTNPLWGAPRIHGELVKLGIDVSQATVATYMVRHRRPPSQTWRTFLANHIGQGMAADFFVVPDGDVPLFVRTAHCDAATGTAIHKAANTRVITAELSPKNAVRPSTKR